MWRIVRNTLLYSLTFMMLNLVLSVSIAVAINEIRRRFLAKAYQSFIILPHFLSMVVVSYLVYAFLQPDHGFINATVLKAFGQDAVFWYSEKEYWPYILVFVNAWKHAGFGAVIYIAAIAGIDPEYYEAAHRRGFQVEADYEHYDSFYPAGHYYYDDSVDGKYLQFRLRAVLPGAHELRGIVSGYGYRGYVCIPGLDAIK